MASIVQENGAVEAEVRIAKRNVLLLTAAQATNYAIAPLSMAIGGLAGHYLLGDDKTFSTLPITGMVLGPLLGSMPAALLMRRVGRRIGFMVGSSLGFLGCGLAALAIIESFFALLCVAMVVIGVSIAFAQQYRFAAADMGSDAFRTKAISWVMVGGLFAAIIGPQTALYFSDYFAPIQFAGSFLGGMMLCTIGFLIVACLKDAPPHAAVTEDTAPVKPARPLTEIAKQPVFLTAVACGASSYMMMALVMTAAPIAMLLCGHSSDMSTLGIQWHVMAMFAPSFFTGNLIVRFGHQKVIGIGFALYVLVGAIALSGIEVAHFWAALIALGVAWNFSYIGATSLVTTVYEPHEKNKVQGFFDTLVFGLVAATSLLSGIIITTFGWGFVIALMVPLMVVGGFALLKFSTKHNLQPHSPERTA